MLEWPPKPDTLEIKTTVLQLFDFYKNMVSFYSHMTISGTVLFTNTAQHLDGHIRHVSLDMFTLTKLETL